MGFSDWTGRIRLFSIFRVASLATGSSRWRRRSPSGRQLAASVGFSGTHLEQVCRPAHNSGERNTPGAHIWRNTGSPRSEHPKHRLPWRSRISSSPRKSSVGARPDLSFRKQQRLTGAVGSAAGGRARPVPSSRPEAFFPEKSSGPQTGQEKCRFLFSFSRKPSDLSGFPVR